MERIEEKEKLLIQCEKDLIKLKQIHTELKKIEVNRKKLNAYYENDYMQDYEEFANKDSNFNVLNQDSIWNVPNDQYYEKIKISKTIINSI